MQIYRGIDKNGKWIYGKPYDAVIDFKKTTTIMTSIYDNYKETEVATNSICLSSNFKCRNRISDNEIEDNIFEGDVVEHYLYNGEVLGVVEYDKQTKCFMVNYDFYNYYGSELFLFRMNWFNETSPVKLNVLGAIPSYLIVGDIFLHTSRVKDIVSFHRKNRTDVQNNGNRND